MTFDRVVFRRNPKCYRPTETEEVSSDPDQMFQIPNSGGLKDGFHLIKHQRL